MGCTNLNILRLVLKPHIERDGGAKRRLSWRRAAMHVTLRLARSRTGTDQTRLFTGDATVCPACWASV
jgi:hypothetical protein